MRKNGQVVIFIILGIVIVLAVVLFFAFSGISQDRTMSSDASRVNVFIQGCSDEVYLDLMYEIGIKGGYFSSPYSSISYGIPLYKIGDTRNVPAVENIESEIARGFNEKLKNYAGGFLFVSGFENSCERS